VDQELLAAMLIERRWQRRRGPRPRPRRDRPARADRW